MVGLGFLALILRRITLIFFLNRPWNLKLSWTKGAKWRLRVLRNLLIFLMAYELLDLDAQGEDDVDVDDVTAGVLIE